ncbi:MAG: hypothetical protein ACNI27_12865 [Desulfovibrio sp.]
MANKASPTNKEAVMYIGPTKMGALHVTCNTVFKGGVLPDHLATAIKSKDTSNLKSCLFLCPRLAKLARLCALLTLTLPKHTPLRLL